METKIVPVGGDGADTEETMYVHLAVWPVLRGYKKRVKSYSGCPLRPHQQAATATTTATATADAGAR